MFDKIVEAFAIVSEEGDGVVGTKGAKVLDKFAEVEGLIGEADAGFEGFEVGVKRGSLGWRRRRSSRRSGRS